MDDKKRIAKWQILLLTILPIGSIIYLPIGISQSERENSMQIEAIRKKAGLSRRELALRSHVTENSIYRYERKNRLPELKIARRIAFVLGCTVDDLLEKDGKEGKAG